MESENAATFAQEEESRIQRKSSTVLSLLLSARFSCCCRLGSSAAVRA